MDQETSDSLDDVVKKEIQKCEETLSLMPYLEFKVEYLQRCVKEEIRQKNSENGGEKKIKERTPEDNCRMRKIEEETGVF